MDNHLFNFKRIRLEDDVAYRHRFLSGVVVVLILMLIIVRYWPEFNHADDPQEQQAIYQDNIFIEHIEITRQQSSPPPPPRPQNPVPVPDDVIIQDPLELEVSLDLTDFAPLDDSMGFGQTGDEPRIVGSPQLAPTVVKIVEPHVPDIPGEIKGKIEMLVNFLVNETGGVEEVSIVQIRIYNSDFTDYETLDTIGFGIMNATLEAAMEWQFRAARHQGEQVWTYTTHRFNY